ncbi:hypothetical protein [Heyndrickxia oleronia]|uniref:DUF7210 family protein n=1 Tax=Heyndrickxia oleronia TaxID=38875 RepID=UPI001C0F06BE|nr:hypothetical protein [Heyndrickxia oleronia]MBU5214952.1 hypothetical protein [Heyndrickxia oleronia]
MDLIALGTVKHNGKWFTNGEQIKKVKKEDGERLIDIGAAKIDEVAERIKAEEEAKKKAEEAARKKAEEEAKKKAESDAESKKDSEKK